jgi:hypothetical protein
MTRQMVCEGPCNPRLPALDAVIGVERLEAALLLRLKSARRTKPMLTSEFLNELVRLKHTDHESEGPRWVCAVCGTGRL